MKKLTNQEMLAKAIKMASEIFENTFDKGGEPYIMHCIRVMQNTGSLDNEIRTIAILHDVLEDTILSYEDLSSMGFSKRVCDAVETLTHKKAEGYSEYIKRISLNHDAIIVKRADLKDNSDITRLKGLRKKDFDRMEKYIQAYTYLKDL